MWRYRPLSSYEGSSVGCMPSCESKKGTAVRCLSAVSALLVVGMVCYVSVPRKPVLCFSVGYPTRFSATVSKVSLAIPFTVTVTNPNYYGMSLPQTTINLVYLNQAFLSRVRTPVILSTVSAPSMHVRAKGNSTVSFTAIVDGKSDTVSADVGVIRDCSATHSTKFYVNASVTLFRWIVIAIPNQPITIKCSVSAFSVAKLLPATDGQAHSTHFCSSS